jgi:hypothetical protein
VKPTCKRVLERLRAAESGWVRGLDLAAPDVGGLRFGGRIHELRAMGYVIERRSDPRSSVDQYRLVEQPVQTTAGLVA